MQNDLNKYLSNILTKAKRQKLRSEFHGEVSKNEAIRKGIHRVPLRAEINNREREASKQPLHHYVFCSHNIPYWRTCTKCGRDANLAQRNASMILKITK